MHPPNTWYADGLRWIGSLFYDAADYLARPAPETASLDPMPRHTSAEEILRDVRNRASGGWGPT